MVYDPPEGPGLTRKRNAIHLPVGIRFASLAVLEMERIAPYEVTGRIGAGAMGEVYRARDTPS